MNNKTTWDLMIETATPEEKREYALMELRHLKSRQKRFNETPPDQRKDMMKTNLEVRKAAQKILKTYEATNEFMYAKNFDVYEKKMNPKYFEKIADNLKKPIAPDTLKGQSVNSQPSEEENILKNINKDRKGLNTIVYYNAEDAAKPRPPKTITPTEDFKTPESERMRVPEFMQEHYKPEPDPDLNEGIATVLGVKYD
jgi:hypothetical protein